MGRVGALMPTVYGSEDLCAATMKRPHRVHHVCKSSTIRIGSFVALFAASQ
jgi:hypothetical protein